MLQKKNTVLNSASIIKLTIILLLFTMLFSACGKSKKEESTPKKQSAGGQQQSDKIPDQLKSMENGIESIIKALDGPAIGVKEQKQGKGGKEQTEGQDKSKKSQGSEGQGSEGQGGGQGGQGKQGQSQKPPEQQKQDPWEKITPIVNDLHFGWNSYMPQAVKKGADKKLIDNFGTALNSLTNTIITKNKTNTLMAASFLYAYVPDFYSLYKTSSSPEIKRIRYYTRNAMLNAMTANWTQADYDMNSLKSSWALYKNIISKEQQDSSNKLDFSIYELEKVIKERNQPIIDIKGRIAMSNIEALEKSMSKEKDQGTEGGSQQGDQSQSDKGGSEGGGSEGGGSGGSEGSGGEGGSGGGQS